MVAVKGTVKDTQRKLTQRLFILHLCHNMRREGLRLLPFDDMVSAFVFVYLHTRDQAQSPTCAGQTVPAPSVLLS